MEEETLESLVQKVIQWANDRNIIQGSTATKQLEKTAAELIELTAAVSIERAYLDADMSYSLDKISGDIASEMGDVLVTLIIVAEQLGLGLHDCLDIAYRKIEHRKGKMIDGKFVKEEDL